MLKTKHYRTERPSSFSALCREWGFIVSIFFRHRELKALFIFSSHRSLPTSIHLKALFMN